MKNKREKRKDLEKFEKISFKCCPWITAIENALKDKIKGANG